MAAVDGELMTAPDTAAGPGPGPGAEAGPALRVVVVDDQAVIRTGLSMIIDHEPDMDAVGEAADGVAAVALVASLRPDVVLMDVRMPVLDGIEATRRIRAGSDSVGIVVLTTFEDDEYVFGSMRAGADGFILKDATPEVLLGAIRAVAAGDAVIDPAVARRVFERWADLDSAGLGGRPELIAGLTGREREVLVALARGGSNRDLAEELIVSEATVKAHVSALMAKLGVKSRVQAVILAYESGLVRPGAINPGALGGDQPNC